MDKVLETLISTIERFEHRRVIRDRLNKVAAESSYAQWDRNISRRLRMAVR